MLVFLIAVVAWIANAFQLYDISSDTSSLWKFLESTKSAFFLGASVGFITYALLTYLRYDCKRLRFSTPWLSLVLTKIYIITLTLLILFGHLEKYPGFSGNTNSIDFSLVAVQIMVAIVIFSQVAMTHIVYRSYKLSHPLYKKHVAHYENVLFRFIRITIILVALVLFPYSLLTQTLLSGTFLLFLLNVVLFVWLNSQLQKLDQQEISK